MSVKKVHVKKVHEEKNIEQVEELEKAVKELEKEDEKPKKYPEKNMIARNVVMESINKVGRFPMKGNKILRDIADEIDKETLIQIIEKYKSVEPQMIQNYYTELLTTILKG